MDEEKERAREERRGQREEKRGDLVMEEEAESARLANHGVLCSYTPRDALILVCSFTVFSEICEEHFL